MTQDRQGWVRLALGISYHGGHYQGWQSQPSGQTIQDQLEKALSQFANHRVSTLCAGRTDAGVHGLMQVVHFDTPALRPEASWVRGTNALLPRDIAVQWAQHVPPEFHCRASALTRRYSYHLLQSPVRPSVEQGRVGWVFRPLAMPAMQAAAACLLGEHDFSSFRASACQALSPVKHLMRLDITQRGAYWRFDFEANAFLHHMIRNLMGCLVMVGDGRKPPGWMAEVLAARDRDAAAPTFSPDGLYFVGPRYAEHWQLPSHTPLFDLLP
ncbi:tRNA pseudouridine(38-40) synthase TruA [Rhodoferax sp.]|uniref:tRNA pseudouridine(38-40) synthase TruA n=1 Tax=Rhodoferax sp. TaxID=50421 RepID=UPI002639F2B9|nr:tRNA pseudouridine(38-40) synthase TruA [Rhodoferax sp.]MDD5000514.1 tRNA pseudouridine(38-40) synthase TruA [Thiomonas arsenitoxydans]MDD5478500.1 tRNA pseudouridine(38-40) synthase TruA [Rhodoferax sp.]